jgi:hypothetical protein
MGVSILTDGDFMTLGLDIAGFKRWRSCKEETNIERFKAWFAANPKTCAAIWLDLQVSTEEGGRIESDANPSFLLLAFRFLKAYPTKKVLSGTFQMTEKTVRTHCSAWVHKLHLLKSKKVQNAILRAPFV